MRLLFLACGFPPDFGGIQKLGHGLTRALGRAGHQVHAIASAQPGAEAFDATSEVPTTRVRRFPGLPSALGLARALRSALRSSPPPEAVVATNWSPDGVAYILAGGRRPPMVLMGYGREFRPDPGRRVRAMAQRGVLQAAAGAIAISRYTADQMAAAGLRAETIRIVHPGVDPGDLTPPEGLTQWREAVGVPPGPVLLTIARLVYRKGVDTVVQALPRIAQSAPEVQYVVIGDGPERERLVELARAVGVSGRTHFRGPAPEAEKLAWLYTCEAFVMPSRDVPGELPEGFGIVYLEANLCGKPVIAARTGGVEDAVEEGVSGLLVRPDRPEEVAEAAVGLLAAPGDARAMGEGGRQRAAERFAWPVVAPQFAEAVEALVRGEG